MHAVAYGLNFGFTSTGFDFVPQELRFIGWAGFLGQEPANIRIISGTTPGAKLLRAMMPRCRAAASA